MEAPFASFVFNQKGPTSLLASVRREAGIVGNTEMVAHVDGPGRIVIATRAAVRARIWSNAPEPSGVDTVKDIEELRAEDVRISDAAAAAWSATVTSDDAIDQFLAELGL
jgi:uncharacterized protein (AIM24 family)